MTANAQTKEQPKWKLFLRRLFSPRPFWRKRLEDQVDGPNSVTEALGEFINRAWAIILGLIVGAVVLTPVLVVIQLVFFSPGFFEHGLADAIGGGLAQVCLSTGNCDLRYLLAGAALAMPMMVVIVYLIGAGLHWRSDEEDEAEVSETELVDMLTVLDERIVRLRADLVLAGVLKLSPEELAEDSEDGPELQPYTPADPEIEAVIDTIMQLPPADQQQLSAKLDQLLRGR